MSTCDGSQSTIKANLNCIIPMNILTASPYNYIFNDLVIVRVSAVNSYG